MTLLFAEDIHSAGVSTDASIVLELIGSALSIEVQAVRIASRRTPGAIREALMLYLTLGTNKL